MEPGETSDHGEPLTSEGTGGGEVPSTGPDTPSEPRLRSTESDFYESVTYPCLHPLHIRVLLPFLQVGTP